MDQNHILCGIQEFTSMKLADQSFTHFTGREVERGQVLVCREAGGLHVIRDRAHFALGHFGLEQLRQDRHGSFKCRRTLLMQILHGLRHAWHLQAA